MGERDLAAGQLVQALRESFRQAPAVDEHQRRTMLLNQLEQGRVDLRPVGLGRRGRGRSAGRGLGHGQRGPGRARGCSHFDVQARGHARIDDLDRARLQVVGARSDEAAGEEAGGFVERPLRRRQADALQRLGHRPHCLQPLERQKQMRAALGRQESVNFVDDDGLQRGEMAPCLRREQQIERLWRRNQQVGARALEPCAILDGRVARARSYVGLAHRH
jgi:hypothetical protein